MENGGMEKEYYEIKNGKGYVIMRGEYGQLFFEGEYEN